MDKPEFRVERGPAATDEAFAIGMAKLLEREGRTIAAAELRRLHPYETAYKEWHEKTEWVQTTARPGEFGMHRADVMRQRLEQAKAQRDALLEALKALVQNEGLEPYSYLDKGIGTATAAGQRWLNARAVVKAVEGEKK